MVCLRMANVLSHDLWRPLYVVYYTECTEIDASVLIERDCGANMRAMKSSSSSSSNTHGEKSNYVNNGKVGRANSSLDFRIWERASSLNAAFVYSSSMGGGRTVGLFVLVARAFGFAASQNLCLLVGLFANIDVALYV